MYEDAVKFIEAWIFTLLDQQDDVPLWRLRKGDEFINKILTLYELLVLFTLRREDKMLPLTCTKEATRFYELRSELFLQLANKASKQCVIESLLKFQANLRKEKLIP